MAFQSATWPNKDDYGRDALRPLALSEGRDLSICVWETEIAFYENDAREKESLTYWRRIYLVFHAFLSFFPSFLSFFPSYLSFFLSFLFLLSLLLPRHLTTNPSLHYLITHSSILMTSKCLPIIDWWCTFLASDPELTKPTLAVRGGDASRQALGLRLSKTLSKKK